MIIWGIWFSIVLTTLHIFQGVFIGFSKLENPNLSSRYWPRAQPLAEHQALLDLPGPTTSCCLPRTTLWCTWHWKTEGWTLVETELSAVMGCSKLGCECSLAHKWVTSNSTILKSPKKKGGCHNSAQQPWPPLSNKWKPFGIPGTAAGNSSCCPAVLPSGNSKSSWTSCSWWSPVMPSWPTRNGPKSMQQKLLPTPNRNP